MYSLKCSTLVCIYKALLGKVLRCAISVKHTQGITFALSGFSMINGLYERRIAVHTFPLTGTAGKEDTAETLANPDI